MGFKVFRMSIKWARLLPTGEEKEPDAEALKNGTVDFVSQLLFRHHCYERPQCPHGGGQRDARHREPLSKNQPVGLDHRPGDGLHWYLNELYDRYQKPLFIVENGLGAEDKLEVDGTIHDPHRIDYMRAHIEAMAQAVEEGVDLMGYTLWGCTDLVSSSTGEMKKRYGLIYVDKNNDGTGDMSRHRKDSFYWYKKVIATNGGDLT